jgi:hypothetical protein
METIRNIKSKLAETFRAIFPEVAQTATVRPLDYVPFEFIAPFYFVDVKTPAILRDELARHVAPDGVYGYKAAEQGFSYVEASLLEMIGNGSGAWIEEWDGDTQWCVIDCRPEIR